MLTGSATTALQAFLTSVAIVFTALTQETPHTFLSVPRKSKSVEPQPVSGALKTFWHWRGNEAKAGALESAKDRNVRDCAAAKTGKRRMTRRYGIEPDIRWWRVERSIVMVAVEVCRLAVGSRLDSN